MEEPLAFSGRCALQEGWIRTRSPGRRRPCSSWLHCGAAQSTVLSFRLCSIRHPERGDGLNGAGHADTADDCPVMNLNKPTTSAEGKPWELKFPQLSRDVSVSLTMKTMGTTFDCPEPPLGKKSRIAPASTRHRDSHRPSAPGKSVLVHRCAHDEDVICGLHLVSHQAGQPCGGRTRARRSAIQLPEATQSHFKSRAHASCDTRRVVDCREYVIPSSTMMVGSSFSASRRRFYGAPEFQAATSSLAHLSGAPLCRIDL